jgi:8-oxo-dGTP pyrophosphatase MutT (NUDIX family)
MTDPDRHLSRPGPEHHLECVSQMAQHFVWQERSPLSRCVRLERVEPHDQGSPGGVIDNSLQHSSCLYSVAMQLNPAVYDLWVFRRRADGVEYLVLRASQAKAARYFNGGRFWQIPSGVFLDGESVPAAVDRELARYELAARAVWAAEHTYTIYNRRFHQIQIISVFAVETDGTAPVRLNPEEHSEHEWLRYEAALARVHFRGLKDGLRSTCDYITGAAAPAPELRLR